jgi:16S rRNA (guanine527-N7)-methyltransferase
MIERLRDAAGVDVSRETIEKLERYVALLKEENARQNLVSAATLEQVWERHILDSAQLVRFEPRPGASWIDIGSGAGLPGIVVAALVKGPVTLVEPRRLRAEFLHKVCESLQLRAEVWSLPKGRSAQPELAEASRSWHFDAREEPSCTNPDSTILVLSRVGAKGQ